MHVSISAEHLFSLFGIPVSNTMLTALVASFLLVIFSYFATRRMKKIPSGMQNFFEWGIEQLFQLVENVMDDRKLAFRFFPLIATFFFFILVSNWMGLLPGFGSIGFYEHGALVPYFRSATADLNTTLAFAMISVIIIQIAGIAALGFRHYGKKFFNFSSPINFFVGLLELISEFAKIISFSFRLFGAVLAGEILLTVITGLVPYVLPLPFMGLELFIGAVQALVFVLLTMVFLKIAMAAQEH
ncbi:MAG: F0F1 ATP synthase subunit A [Candidatus Paceibacterota bacterium]|jgi:F-type H+-transporting ATPase subunit a|nr:F0F1 ATP synthase subunit A [Candidatus Paceibacterota bacterium]